jgi:hypothetical protein
MVVSEVDMNGKKKEKFFKIICAIPNFINWNYAELSLHCNAEE